MFSYQNYYVIISSFSGMHIRAGTDATLALCHRCCTNKSAAGKKNAKEPSNGTVEK